MKQLTWRYGWSSLPGVMDEEAYLAPWMKKLTWCQGWSGLPGAMDEAAYLAPWIKRFTWRHGWSGLPVVMDEADYLAPWMKKLTWRQGWSGLPGAMDEAAYLAPGDRSGLPGDTWKARCRMMGISRWWTMATYQPWEADQLQIFMVWCMVVWSIWTMNKQLAELRKMEES